MRNYEITLRIKVVGTKKKRYGDFTKDSLANSVKSVKEGMSIREAANLFRIPYIGKFVAFKQSHMVGKHAL